MSDTIAAIATGAQVAAIGIIRLSGPESIPLMDRLFKPMNGRPMSQAQDRTLVYGRLYNAAGDLLDVCLCTISHGPGSYTGEDTAELQCHGSPVVLRAVLDELFQLGARHARPGEFTKRAFLNGRMELTAAEAVADLIDAESIDYAKNAAGQLSGAVSRRIDGIYSALTDISSHYHAVLDYPDEDIEDFRLESYREQLGAALAQLQQLLDSFGRGKLMRAGIPAAIVGRPNAGKSSLLNALLGYDRAIVTDVPGTTRDTIEEKLRLGGLTLKLCDTAGIHDTDDRVEQLGVERSRKALEAADLVLAVVDGSVPPTAEDLAVLRLAAKAPRWIAVFSKCDLWDTKARSVGVIGQVGTPAASVSLSAVTGQGLARLEAAVAALFPAGEAPDSGSLLTDQRQEEAARRARDAVRRAKEALAAGLTPDAILTAAAEALAALGELTGRTAKEEIVSRIFSRFCVGK